MAYFFVNLAINTRSKGGRALRRSAYQRCSTSENALTDEAFDFSRKADELAANGVLLPEGADPKFLDPDTLWQEVENIDNRVNSQLARTMEISIPNEIPESLRDQFLIDMAQPYVDRGFAVEWARHNDDGIFQDVENPHGHFQITMRPIIGSELGPKDREFSQIMRDQPRKKLADQMNDWMQKHGIDAQVSHLGNGKPKATAAVRRQARKWKESGCDPETITPALRTHFAAVEEWQKDRDEQFEIIAEANKLTAEIEMMEKELAATSEENIEEEISNDGARRLSGSNTAERAVPRDERPVTGPSSEAQADQSSERRNRSDRDGGRQERGDLRATERAADGRRLGAGTEPRSYRDDARDVRPAAREDRSQTGDTRRRLRTPTLAEKIRRDDAARPTNERMKRLEQRILKRSATPAIPLTLLDRIRRNDVAARFMKRLDTLEKRITKRRNAPTLAQKIMREDAGFRMNRRLDSLERKLPISPLGQSTSPGAPGPQPISIDGNDTLAEWARSMRANAPRGP